MGLLVGAIIVALLLFCCFLKEELTCGWPPATLQLAQIYSELFFPPALAVLITVTSVVILVPCPCLPLPLGCCASMVRQRSETGGIGIDPIVFYLGVYSKLIVQGAARLHGR